jgi:hypothetical protein
MSIELPKSLKNTHAFLVPVNSGLSAGRGKLCALMFLRTVRHDVELTHQKQSNLPFAQGVYLVVHCN